jgi:hypothetical protein
LILVQLYLKNLDTGTADDTGTAVKNLDTGTAVFPNERGMRGANTRYEQKVQGANTRYEQK